jgi:hypothetical protein
METETPTATSAEDGLVIGERLRTHITAKTEQIRIGRIALLSAAPLVAVEPSRDWAGHKSRTTEIVLARSTFIYPAAPVELATIVL